MKVRVLWRMRDAEARLGAALGAPAVAWVHAGSTREELVHLVEVGDGETREAALLQLGRLEEGSDVGTSPTAPPSSPAPTDAPTEGVAPSADATMTTAPAAPASEDGRAPERRPSLR